MLWSQMWEFFDTTLGLLFGDSLYSSELLESLDCFAPIDCLNSSSLRVISLHASSSLEDLFGAKLDFILFTDTGLFLVLLLKINKNFLLWWALSLDWQFHIIVELCISVKANTVLADLQVIVKVPWSNHHLRCHRLLSRIHLFLDIISNEDTWKLETLEVVWYALAMRWKFVRV